eukprot:300384-Chlamydomonas_euryale.AAC.1
MFQAPPSNHRICAPAASTAGRAATSVVRPILPSHTASGVCAVNAEQSSSSSYRRQPPSQRGTHPALLGVHPKSRPD